MFCIVNGQPDGGKGRMAQRVRIGGWIVKGKVWGGFVEKIGNLDRELLKICAIRRKKKLKNIFEEIPSRAFPPGEDP